MHFIAMDLKGKFKLSPQGHQYNCTVIGMLTNYTWCVLLYTKEAYKVVHAYLVNIYSKHGRFHFVRQWNWVQEKIVHASCLHFMKQAFTSHCYLCGIWHIENVQNFLMKYIQKHIYSELAWDEVIHIACVAHNFVPNEHFKKSAFFFIFGWDVHMPEVQLLIPKFKYMNREKSLLTLDALRYIYALAIHNI